MRSRPVARQRSLFDDCEKIIQKQNTESATRGTRPEPRHSLSTPPTQESAAESLKQSPTKPKAA